MTTPTHVAAGFLLVQGLAFAGRITPQEATNLSLWSVLAANGPDFDVLNYKVAKNHRWSSLLHMPLVWLLAFIIAFACTHFSGQIELTTYLWIAFLNVLGHFILDSVDSSSGIPWLAPFSRKLFSARKASTPSCIYNMWRYVLYYVKQPDMLFEIGVWVIAGVLWLHTVPNFTSKVQAKNVSERRPRISDIIRLKTSQFFIKQKLE